MKGNKEMNTITFESLTEATGNYMICNIDADITPDRIAVKMLSSDLPFFLVPVKLMNKFDKRIVKYETGKYKSILSLQMRMNKTECCNLLYNMLYPMMCCDEWLLDYHKLCFEKSYILCDSNTFDVRYLYILDEAYSCSDRDIMDTVREIFRNVDIIDDKDFRIDLLQALIDESFSVNSLYEMIREKKNKADNASAVMSAAQKKQTAAAEFPRHPAEERSPAAAKPRGHEGTGTVSLEKIPENKLPYAHEKKDSKPVLSALLSSMQEKAAKTVAASEDDDDFDPENLFRDDRKKPAAQKTVKEKAPLSLPGIFRKNKGAKTSAVTAAPIEDDHTEIVGIAGRDGDETQISAAELVLVSSEIADPPIVIPLTIREGESITIGRKSSNSDSVNADIEFPSDCTKISRKHCCIKAENDGYSICDLNSGNGTYADGKRIGPGEWTALKEGSTVTFGSNVAVYSLKINM